MPTNWLADPLFWISVVLLVFWSICAVLGFCVLLDALAGDDAD